MAATLQEILLTPDNRPKVVADCQTLIDQEVSDKAGISGTAIKLAYKTVTGSPPAFPRFRGHAAAGLRGPTGALLRRLQGRGRFGIRRLPGQARGRGLRVPAVGHGRACREPPQRAPINKAYNTVRPSGVKSVEAALPRTRRPDPEVRGLTTSRKDPFRSAFDEKDAPHSAVTQSDIKSQTQRSLAADMHSADTLPVAGTDAPDEGDLCRQGRRGS